MKEITVYEGEYEYLIENDPNFRIFVEACEGKSINQILGEIGWHENWHEFQ